MQSDIPPLPISCLNDNRNTHRNDKLKTKLQRNITQDRKNNSSYYFKHNSSSIYRNVEFTARLSPYKSSARFNPPDTVNKSPNKSIISQRVSSAKMLRIKQLQNQLADAHFHLNELSNENKLLKAIQKRQDSALKRYEGTNAELPRIINSHQEDYRVLQTKYKKLKTQYKEISDTLKEKENELHSLQAQNKKLLQLSKDRHLGERDKLQMQVQDLNHRINQQDEIIQTLKRKLALESKYLKHQLHVEMVKHKETQKQLQDSRLKLKSLEELQEQREKKAYQVSRMFFYNKAKPTVTSQSLTNLNEHKSENVIKGHSFRRRRSEAINQSLPALNGATPFSRSQSQETPKKPNQESSVNLTETFLNFEQVRNFRLSKSPALHRAAFSTSRSSIRDSPIEESQLEESNVNESQFESNTSLKNFEKKSDFSKYNYPSDDEKDQNNELDVNNVNQSSSLNLANRSRLLHARLINSTTEEAPTDKTEFLERSQSLTQENNENVENDTEITYNRDSVITVISKDMLKDDTESMTTYSNSDVESDMEIPIAFNEDEDDNVARKSDIVIDESEIDRQLNTSSHLSKLFTQFHKPSNSLDSREINDEQKLKDSKTESESVSSSFDDESVVEDTKEFLDDFTLQKTYIPKEIDTKIAWDKNNENSILDKNLNSDKDIDIKDTKDQSLDNYSQDFDEITKPTTKIKDINDKSDKPNGKIVYDYSEKSDVKNNVDQKTVNESSKAFDKAKLLAAMKAIDDNENIEFVEQKVRKSSGSNRSKITENLYRGVPTHSRRKSDIMKELFADTNLDNKKITK